MKFTFTININTARFVSAENTQHAQGPVQFSYFYHPQTKFAKVMFSQTSGSGGAHPPGQTPPAQRMLGYTPLPNACWDTPPLMDTTGCGQQAGGTHPTGMHSCLLILTYGNYKRRLLCSCTYLITILRCCGMHLSEVLGYQI